LNSRFFSVSQSIHFWALALSAGLAAGQEARPQAPPPPPGAKSLKCAGKTIPQLVDVTEKAGIKFTHASAPESKYVVESMSGGVLLLDYDRDGLAGHLFYECADG